jgi:hypothetical protein
MFNVFFLNIILHFNSLNFIVSYELTKARYKEKSSLFLNKILLHLFTYLVLKKKEMKKLA